MVIDGQDATVEFNGAIIGGVLQIVFSQSDSREVPHRPLNSQYTKWLPGQVSYGMLTLQLYRNDADPGQAELLSSRDNRGIYPMLITFKDGTTKSFSAYTRSIPIVGGEQGVNTGSVTLRIAEQVT